MALPTSGISFSTLQAEFGGSNPISMSEYFKGGAYVPSGQATSATDGVAIPASGTIRMGEFRGLTKTASSGTTTTWYNTYNLGTRTTAGNVTTGVRFESGGVVIGTTLNAATNSSIGTNTTWYSPATGGIGNSYWIRATLQSGSGSYAGTASAAPNAGTMGSWLQLSSNQTWSNSTFGSTGFSGRYSLIKFEISTNSSGTNIVASGNIGIEAIRDA